jgi:hypothetical protein
MKFKTLFVALLVTGGIAASAEGQRRKPGSISVNPTIDARKLEAPTGARDPVSMETVALTRDPRDPKPAGPDLTVTRIGLDPEGRIRYTAANATFGATVNPFVADLFVDEERKDTVKHPALAALTAQAVTTATLFPDCGTHTIRIQLDPQQIVAETTENNNERSSSLTPPCPDVAVVGIKKNWQNNNTRFRAHVTVQNIGDAPTPAGIVLMVNTYPSVGISENTFINLPAMAPGELLSFNAGDSVLGTNNLGVTANADHYETLKEKNEVNNLKKETL